MNFLRYQKYIELYIKGLPLMVIYPMLIGIEIGINENKKNSNLKPFDIYSNVIGYPALGIITGITYPISYPLFGSYVLYRNSKITNL